MATSPTSPPLEFHKVDLQDDHTHSPETSASSPTHNSTASSSGSGKKKKKSIKKKRRSALAAALQERRHSKSPLTSPHSNALPSSPAGSAASHGSHGSHGSPLGLARGRRDPPGHVRTAGVRHESSGASTPRSPVASPHAGGEAVPFIPFACRVFFPEQWSVSGSPTQDDEEARCVLVVRLAASQTVESVVLSVLQHCKEGWDAATLARTAAALELVVANSSGRVDTDFPRLDPRKGIDTLGVQHFLLRRRMVVSPMVSAASGAAPTTPAVLAVNVTGLAPRTPELWLGGPPVSAGTLRSQLCRCSETGDLAGLTTLIEQHLVDPSTPGIDNFTPLHFAARKGHLNILSYLVRKAEDVDLDAATRRGWTALHLAASRGHYDAAELLLSAGASMHVTTTDGQTPLDCARAAGCSSDLVALFEEFAALEQ